MKKLYQGFIAFLSFTIIITCCSCRGNITATEDSDKESFLSSPIISEEKTTSGTGDPAESPTEVCDLPEDTSVSGESLAPSENKNETAAPTTAPLTEPHSVNIIPGQVLLKVEDVTSAKGKEVKVGVQIYNNPGIAGARIRIGYDDKLTLVSAQSGEVFKSLDYTGPGRFDNPCSFTWDSEFGMAQEDGCILWLTFSIPDRVEIGHSFLVSCTYKSGDIYNEALEDVDLMIENGYITVAA